MKMSRFLKLMFIVFSVAALTAGAVGTFAQGGTLTLPHSSRAPRPTRELLRTVTRTERMS